MKIAVIGFNDFVSMPYMRFYKRLLDENGVGADYYCWDRSKNAPTKKDESGIVTLGIRCTGSRIRKFGAMLKWKKAVLKLLRREKYDRLIVLTTLPAYLLKGYLLRNYKGRYLIDIRDFTYDHIGFYRKAVGKLCRSSGGTFVSSEGFKRMLDDPGEVIPIHNVDITPAPYGLPDLNKKELTIGYVGLVKYYASNVHFLSQFKKSGYRFCYYGIYADGRLQEYCRENHFENAEFYGRFSSEEKNQIYKDIDLVNCYFGKDNFSGQKMLLPNRLYDAVYSNRPVVTNGGSYLAECVRKYSLGLVISDENRMLEETQAYVQGFDADAYVKGVAKFRQLIESQQKTAAEKILRFCRGQEVAERRE